MRVVTSSCAQEHLVPACNSRVLQYETFFHSSNGSTCFEAIFCQNGNFPKRRSRFVAVTVNCGPEHYVTGRTPQALRHNKFSGGSKVSSHISKTVLAEFQVSTARSRLRAVTSNCESEHFRPPGDELVPLPTTYFDGSSGCSCVCSLFILNVSFPNGRNRLRAVVVSCGREPSVLAWNRRF